MAGCAGTDLTASCALHAAGQRRALPLCPPSMPSSCRAAAAASRRAGATDLRCNGALGCGLEAHSGQPHWLVWSQLLNMRTWLSVPVCITIAQAFTVLMDKCGAAHGLTANQIWALFRSNPVELSGNRAIGLSAIRLLGHRAIGSPPSEPPSPPSGSAPLSPPSPPRA